MLFKGVVSLCDPVLHIILYMNIFLEVYLLWSHLQYNKCDEKKWQRLVKTVVNLLALYVAINEWPKGLNSTQKVDVSFHISGVFGFEE